VAVDINPQALAQAHALGAATTVDGRALADVPAAIADATRGGAQVSIDALGDTATCRNSILCLAPQGRHVQAGLLEGEHADPRLPMGAVIGRELEILGTHGMAAHRFPRMLDMTTNGRLAPERLIGRRITLDDAPAALTGLAEKRDPGVTVIEFGA
jgi:alcohol dehydrogenase